MVWRCVRDKRQGRRGLVPLKTANVNDEDGNICSTPPLPNSSMRDGGGTSFKVLNIMTKFDQEELMKARQ